MLTKRLSSITLSKHNLKLYFFGKLTFSILLFCSACVDQSKESLNQLRIKNPKPNDLINGQPIKHEDVFLSTVSIPGCTAARVGPRHILTAAHCVVGVDKKAKKYTSQLKERYRPGQAIRFNFSFFVKIEQVLLHPSYLTYCKNSCDYNFSINSPYPADAAIIILSNELPDSIQTAKIDTNPVLNNTEIFVGGFGCEHNLKEESLQSRLKYAKSKVQSAFEIEEKFDNSFDLNESSKLNIKNVYLTSPGPVKGKQFSLENPGLCPGDSGGPVYKAEGNSKNLKVVGINAYYLTRDSLPAENLFTRLDCASAHNTAEWLESISGLYLSGRKSSSCSNRQKEEREDSEIQTELPIEPFSFTEILKKFKIPLF